MIRGEVFKNQKKNKEAAAAVSTHADAVLSKVLLFAQILADKSTKNIGRPGPKLYI